MSCQSIDRTEIKLKSRSLLRGNWPICVGVTLIYFLAVFLVDYIIGFLGLLGMILSILITPALVLSLLSFFVNSIKRRFFAFEHMKINFNMYIKILLFLLLVSISFIPYIALLTVFFITSYPLSFILTIVSICFCVYVSLAFFAVPFIIIETNGENSVIDSMKECYNLTKGYVLNLLIFTLSFLGWQILCIFSFGIGFFWLIPYMYVAEYLYYKKLQNIKFSEVDFVKTE